MSISVNQTNCLKFYRNCFVVAVLFLIVGCVTNQYPYPTPTGLNDRVVGVGYAVINAQPGKTPEEKRLMAIKASKLEAYKSLAEQIYGQYLESRGSLSNLKMGDDELISRVEGLIVGARVVSIKPISADSYETVLEIGQVDATGLVSESEEGSDLGAARGGS